MSRKHNFVWKIVTGGQGGVGKTTFLLRYMTHEFVGDTSLTIGVNFHTSVLKYEDENVTLMLWDLGGQERFRFVQGSYIKGASGALVFFDVGRLKSLYDLEEWFKLIRENSSQTIPILLVGTKIDLEDEATQTLAKEEALHMVQQYHLMGYVPTSSKSGKNVEEAIHQMVGMLIEQEKKKLLAAETQSLISPKTGKKQ